MDLEIRHFRLVAAIADAGSVTRAGELLHLTQSALSHQLHDIEDRLSAQLFHRVGRRMVPTEAGRHLIGIAAEVLAVVERAEAQIRRGAQGREGSLRISTECYTCYHWLPALLKRFRAIHPTVDVQIDANATANPISALLDGKLDIAVVAEPTRDKRLVSHPLFDDDMVVIVAPDHALADRAFVRPEDFRNETVLLYARKEDSVVYQRVIARAGIVPRALQQVQLTEAMIELVKAGAGVAFLSTWAVAPYLESRAVRGIRLTQRGYRRRWSAVTLKNMAAVPYVVDFIGLISRNPPTVAAPRPLLRIPRRAAQR